MLEQGLDDANLENLGFRPEDRADLLAHAARLDDPDRARVADAAGRLEARVGDLEHPWPRVLADLRDEPGRPMGLLPLLALVASADAVRRFHAARGVPPEVSASGLRDLGQQVSVHRRTYGAFGLHTQGWLVCVWSGAYFWLGRLAFNLTRLDGRWVIDTHIPESGPLTPGSVDDSFARAREVFGTHFADLPAEEAHCRSWLLDPQLAEVLPGESNMVRFQRRWGCTATQTSATTTRSSSSSGGETPRRRAGHRCLAARRCSARSSTGSRPADTGTCGTAASR